MTKKIEFWSTLLIGLIAALSWTPFLMDKFSPNQFEGKLISQYDNITKDKKNILFLFKISVISLNKDFFLKDVDLNIKFQSSNLIKSTSRNNRLVVFTFDSPKRLTVPDNEFINNLSILPKDIPIVGYLSFLIHYDKDEPIDFIEFVFISFDGKTKKLRFNSDDIKEEKLLFDDSIWENFNFDENRYRNLIKIK